MAQYMVNIPRRKIYEKLLEYEDAVLEMQVLLYSEKNFKQYEKKFEEKGLPLLKEAYAAIKTLLKIFFENHKFSEEKEFDQVFNIINENQVELSEYLESQKILPDKFKKVIAILDQRLKITKLEGFEETQKLFVHVDVFNSYIPKLLELRRNETKGHLER